MLRRTKKMPAPKGHKPFPGGETGGLQKIHTIEFIDAEAEAFDEWMRKPDSIYIKSFALQRGYHPNRLAEFAKKSERFTGVYERAKQWQEEKLLLGGLKGEFVASFTKFAMANICGWRDQAQVQVSGSAENPLSVLLMKIDGRSKEVADDDEDD